MGTPSPATDRAHAASDKQPAPTQKPPAVSSTGVGLQNPLRRFHGRRVVTYLGLVLVLLPMLSALYVYLRLHWSYADGDRSGLLHKFSRKGWFCKTYEGELTLTNTPGEVDTSPHSWSFTVRDDNVAKQVNAALGHKVVLHYEQHPGVPTTCFGDTEYFVDAVRVLE